MDSFVQDLRYSLRSLGKHPGLVLVAVLSLAVGIGVNTAIFSVLNALLLRPVPVREPDRAVVVYHASPDRSDRGTSFPAYSALSQPHGPLRRRHGVQRLAPPATRRRRPA